jgi:hypothetical protein
MTVVHFITVDDRAHGELRLHRHADFAHQDQVERSAERGGDLGGDRHAAPRQGQHHRMPAAISAQRPGQRATGESWLSNFAN